MKLSSRKGATLAEGLRGAGRAVLWRWRTAGLGAQGLHAARLEDRRSAPFVVGVGRSGTTLLRFMLDAHPDLAVPPETGFLLPFLLPGTGSTLGSAAELLAAVTGFHTWSDFGLAPEAYERELRRLEPFELAAGIRAFYRLYAAGRGKGGWGDKTPAYGAHLEALHRLLPEARFVHLVRDGRDVALSLREVWFAPARDAEGLARHWASRLQEIRRAGRRVPYYLEIRYEDLVAAPRPTLERIARFLDLPFHPAMEDHAAAGRRGLDSLRDQRLPDGHVVTRETRLRQQHRVATPPDCSRIGRFRREMTAAERRAFERVAGPLLFELGYEV